jgi:23S rRNA (adenine2503-C2)-methyltransferase
MKKDDRINLKDLTIEETTNLVKQLGKAQFTGKQLFKWVFKHGVDDFSQMTDLSKDFRELLEVTAVIKKLKLAKTFKSSDGTRKTVWEIEPNNYIESVLIPDDDRLTLCVSSQAGCPVGCQFCATGLGGFRRNLTSGEIYDQYLLTKMSLSETTHITNIVFMGMGEPLINYNNVIKATRILNDTLGAGMAARRITISTVGYVEGIKRLADEHPHLGLAISLHSAIDRTRNVLIPIAEKYSLSALKEAAIYHVHKTGERVTFEYLLLKDINDSIEDAKALAEYIQGIPCKLNLIVYNEVSGTPFETPSERRVTEFRDYLYPRAPIVTIRKSMGADIGAACGQLAGSLTGAKVKEH